MNDAEYKFYIDWNNDGNFDDSYEDVTSYVLADSDVQVSYGRDGARSLSAIAAGEVELTLNNIDGRFSPENTSSPLYGMLVPGRLVQITATHLGTTRTMFRGFIDEFELEPDVHSGTCKISVLDMLSKLAAAQVSTDVYASLQTGEAVNVLLDQIGWDSAARDIDAGATTLRWWSADATDALEVLGAIIDAEGPPAVAYVDGPTFIFRDRHHRILNAESSTVQRRFTSGEVEPTFCQPFTYNIGWKDLVNSIQIAVPETQPDDMGTIFSSEDVIAMVSGESRVFEISGGGGQDSNSSTDFGGSSGQTSSGASAAEGFIDAIPPVSGIDYTVVSGSFNVNLSRTNGSKATLEVICTSTGSLVGLKVRGRAIIERNTVVVRQDDTGSQSEYGIRTLNDNDLSSMGNQHDALAIAKIIIAQRAQRLPVISLTVNNGNDTRFTEILSRQISDRIHVVEPKQTFLDHDFFIDRIEHNIAQAGKDHRATFFCEKSPTEEQDPDPPVWFTFDDANAGFDEGQFCVLGMTFTETVMILDDPTTGQLGTGGLGW